VVPPRGRTNSCCPNATRRRAGCCARARASGGGNDGGTSAGGDSAGEATSGSSESSVPSDEVLMRRTQVSAETPSVWEIPTTDGGTCWPYKATLRYTPA
jgi:hypothetical protein